MSSTQSFTKRFDWDDAATYLTKSGNVDLAFSFLDNCVATIKLGGSTTASGYATFNDTLKNSLFPNVNAKPTSISLETHTNCSGSPNNVHITFEVNGTVISTATMSTSTRTWSISSSDAAVKAAKKDSVFRFHLWKTATTLANPSVNVKDYVDCTFYFTRYDLAATAGAGIASATVSAGNGYEGDTVTYTASLQSGYTFDGWYNGSTKVSSNQTYVHTVSGDITLQARATAPTTATVRTSYNGTVIATETRTPPISVSYGWSVIASISRGQTKTLTCNGKLMSGNVVIGGKTLNCNGKVMSDNVTISVT